MKRMAFLVLNPNVDLVERGLPLKPFNSEEVTNRIKSLVIRCKYEKIPVVYVTDSHTKLDREFEIEGFRVHALRGTDGEQIIRELKGYEDYIVCKRCFNGFLGTDLDLYLREEGIEKVIVTGGLINLDVRFTCVDAYQRRYKVIVLTDCLYADSEDRLNRIIREMFFTKRVTSEEFISWIKYL